MNILITAGPTREYLDPVRYLSNESSGKMGFAFAEAAHALGADVTLIAGPVDLATPKGATRIDVTSSDEMYRAVMNHARRADIIVMAAAVADAKPARRSKTKLKKPLKPLKLVPTRDILAELGKKKRDEQLLVGFALETTKLIANAQKKLKKKNCDWIVANSAQALGADASKATLIPKHGKQIALPKLHKHDLAVVMLSHVFA